MLQRSALHFLQQSALPTLAAGAGGRGTHSDGFFTATLACVSVVSAVCWMKSNLHITARMFHQGADWSPGLQPCMWVLHAVVLREARVPLYAASHAQGWILLQHPNSSLPKRCRTC